MLPAAKAFWINIQKLKFLGTEGQAKARGQLCVLTSKPADSEALK